MPFNFLEFLSFRMISIPIRCLLSMRLKTELLFYFFTQTADHHHSSLLSRPLGFRIKLSPNGLIPEYKLFMRCRCCNRKYGSSFYFVYLFNFFSRHNPPTKTIHRPIQGFSGFSFVKKLTPKTLPLGAGWR